MAAPESLQICCFTKLINDFETFPPESLALLPLRLRYELIRNLPAVDVCQLEQSSFVKGLDTEEVWAAIVKKCWIRRPSRAMLSKDCFCSEVCRIIFNVDRKDGILELMYRKASPLQFPGTRASLPRSLSNPAECIRLVLEKTRHHPKALEIEVTYTFYEYFLSTENSPWLDGGEYHQLLVEYLSEVTCLTLIIRGPTIPFIPCQIVEEKVNKVILFIMPILSKKRQLHLKELSIVDQANHNQYLMSVLCTISPYLKICKTKAPRKCVQPLESLSIISNFCNDSYVPSEGYILELVEIIESQGSLCRLQLEMPGHISTAKETRALVTKIKLPVSCRLCTALAGLLRQPQFCEMKVTMQIPSPGFQEIIHSFIATPRSSDCSLHLEGVIKDFGLIHRVSSLAGDLSCLSPPQENILHKTLILDSDPPNTVLQWLHEHVVLRLKELRVHEYSMSLTLSYLLSHPQIEVETIFVTFSDGISPDQSFDHLLQNVHLKHISLDTLNFDDQEQDTFDISSLIRGLYKQAHLGTLETLKIRFAGNYDEDDISQLFEAIVSLPQLENFTLDIEFSNFTDQHVAILCKVWKNTARGKKFKKLRFSSCRTFDPFILEDITRELVN